MQGTAAPPPLLLLVLLAAIQPFALNVIAPATPGLARALGAEYGTIALTLSLYLYTVAVTQLFSGPLSDRNGRRPVILGGLVVFLVGTTIAALAENVPVLFAGRMLQGAGAGTVFTLVRAVIRDTASGPDAASRLGYMMTIMLVVPMLAPGLGGLVDQSYGWRAVFATMAVPAVAVLAVAWHRLRETNLHRRADASVRDLAAGFPMLLRDPAYLASVGALTSSGMIFFSFLGAAPYIVVDHMRQPSAVYGFWFALMAGGYMIGNFLVGRLAHRLGIERLIALGTTVTAASAVLVLASLAIFGWTPAALFLPMFLSSLGNGLTMPSAMTAALSVRPSLAGSASGLAGALQLGIGATASSIVSYAVTWTPWALIVVILLGAALGCAANLWLMRQRPNGRDAG